ncbi:MAG: hypothetical protein RL681_344 [Candidatus Parcubacteria bacterium]|jgi:hypothetical protein
MHTMQNRMTIVRIGIAAATLALAVSLPHLAGAQYYGVPQAQTGQATNMTQNSVTVNGWVNPNNSQTSYRFEYGTSYGSLYQNTQFIQLGSGIGSIPVSAVLSGLQQNTTYYVRLVAQNSYGQADGGVVSFQTIYTSGNYYGGYGNGTGNITIYPQSMTLSAGQSYYFSAFYDPDGPGGTTSQVSISTSATWNTSNPAVIAHLGGGHFVAQSGGTATITATYLNGFGQATVSVYQAQSATVAETQNAANVTQTSATLRGAVNPQGSQTNAYFEYGTSSSLGTRAGDQTLYGVSGSQYLTYQLTNLSPRTTYFYRVAAQNQNGVSYGSILQFTTMGSGSQQNTGTGTGTYRPPVTQPSTTPRPSGNTGSTGSGQGTTGTGTSVVAITAGTEQMAGGQLPVTVSTMRPEPGATMTYAIRYSVTGGTGVKNATLALVLPAEIELISATPAPSETSVNGASFSLGDLKAGTTGTVTAILRVKDSAKPGSQIVITAILNYTGSEGQMQSGTATTPLTVIERGASGQDGRGTLASATSVIPGGSLVVWLLAALLLVNIAHFAYSIAKSRRKREQHADPRAAVYAGNHYGSYAGDREKSANPAPRREQGNAPVSAEFSPRQTGGTQVAGNGNGGIVRAMNEAGIFRE